jgi:RNA polymerase sigma-70 factor (ECF subfamily)
MVASPIGIDEPTDDDLARRALVEGDSTAWPTLFNRFTPRLLGLARSLGRIPRRPEDLVQEAWLKILQAPYDPARPFAPFALRVTRNLWVDAVREAGRRPPPVELPAAGLSASTPGPDELLQAFERAEAIQQCLERLEELEREVMRLHFQDGLAYAEIATTVDRREGQVKGLSFRAGRKLLRCLGLAQADADPAGED